MDDTLRIALLIDADNAPAGKIDVILSELARHGVASVRRAYGNWKSPNLKRWEEALHPHAIQPVQQFAYTSGKNASDMAIVIDAMDLLHSERFNAFAIVSSDADFTPLVMRLRAHNARVFGFGEQKTPMPFVKACSTFLYLEQLETPDEKDDSGHAQHPAKPKTSGELRQDPELLRLLRGAVAATRNDDGWSFLGTVGSHLGNQGSFDARNYGYPNLSGLIEALDLFELRREGQLVHVREREASGARAKKAARRK